MKIIGHALIDYGINNIAYSYEDALRILEVYKKQGLIILGGDVMKLENDNFEYSYDNRLYEEEVKIPEESYDKAKSYILNYQKSDNVYFVFSLLL